MLRLNLSNENARELALTCDGANHELLSDSDLEAVGNEIIGAALRDLSDRGIDYERAYSQSVGSFVIVQDCTPSEREAWQAAIDRAMPAANRLTSKLIAHAEVRNAL